MIRPTFQTLVRGTVAAAALSVMAVGVAMQPAEAGGIRDCSDVTGKGINQVGCFETVWSGGLEYRMTFSNLSFSGNTPKALDPFYVTAPQTSTPQGHDPRFLHDHVVRAIPQGNAGTYSTKLQGFFVLCSGQGLTSGACVPFWASPAGDPLPFARTASGHALTSADAIESAAAAGDLALVDLGQGAVIVGSISGNH